VVEWRMSRIVLLGMVLIAASSCAKPPAVPSSAPIAIDPHGVAGTVDAVGCGDRLWRHVHDPERLVIKNDCVTVTGVIMDSTAAMPEPDGVRHEPDGDTHGWLKVDLQFANLLNGGNASDQQGNLVFEIVCHYAVTQADSIGACANFTDTQQIPRVGTHVAMTGSFVLDTNHAMWNEIHPVSRIQVQ
jgi:hypothetical protein